MADSNFKEVLNFYHENGLDEILSEKPIDRFLESQKIKAKIEQKSALKKAEIQKSQVREIKKDVVDFKQAPKINQQIDSKSDNQSQSLAFSNLASKKESFIKPVFSTSMAVSGLAQRFKQNNDMSSQNNNSFKSLNEIVEQAKELAKKAQNSLELKQIVEEFDGCNLKKMATNTVFCDGNPDSKIMVIGEAPGNHEDLQGIPFCGDSGKVLDAMFEAINMKRANDYYISNVIFWRPPGNRKPTSEELAICQPFVERHIQLIAPKVIILVGATAMSAILNRFEPITQIRGQFIDFAPTFLEKPTKTFAIFHPSYLMRQPAKKKIAWQDMLALEEFMKSS